MSQRLARFGGVGPLLLGLGLSVTGWTNPAVGVTLMVLGVLWVAVGIAGPPIAVRAKTAIVAGVAEELKVTLGKAQEAQDVDHKRWLKGVIRRMLGELTVASERLNEAQSQGHYWHSDVYALVSDEWSTSHKAISDEPELQEHYMDVRLAFEELNRINVIVIGRWSHPLFPSSAVDPNDRLQDAIKRVDDGARWLKLVGDSL